MAIRYSPPVHPVQLQEVLHVPQVDELVDLPVAVAGEVGDHRPALGPLAQPVDGDGGEELAHRPVVGHRLEEREVAVVGVAELLLEAFQLVRDVGQVADDLQDLLARRPEQLLHAGAGLEVEHPHVEGGDRLLLDLEGVVVGLLEFLPETPA